MDTSAICLDITAHQGGGLLGDLLCGVANLLNQGVPLGDILAGLTGSQLNTLLNWITDLLNDVLSLVTSSNLLSMPTGHIAVSGPACNILNLSLGPIDLNLLGLEVALDNCHNGPVTVDITAVPGSLLGDLLCDLANLLNNGHSTQTAILNNLKAIAAAILLLI